jgi:hypothetical protein
MGAEWKEGKTSADSSYVRTYTGHHEKDIEWIKNPAWVGNEAG